MLVALIAILIAAIAAVGIVLGVKAIKKRHSQRLELIKTLAPQVKAAFEEIGKYYSYGHYITESERMWLNEKYAELYKGVKSLVGTKELNANPGKDIFLRFRDALKGSKEHKQINNDQFIHRQLESNREYFDSVLPHPLDDQQREAIVSLEDNVLVISSAGSGKTMTTVGKVRYLIDKIGVPAEKILLITFTRKAAESLSERLGEKDLKCRTFHKLALEIIGAATGAKPTITASDFSLQVYRRLMDENGPFRDALADYIIRSRYSMKDQFEYSSNEEYMQDRKKFGIPAMFNDMDGRPIFCKSEEESRIADFLGSRGINFRYEEKFEFGVADKDHRQYCPDFSIYIRKPDGKVKRIYLEHFAINEEGHCPPFFSGDEELEYKQGISWKRNLHRLNGTVLWETSSADFHRGNVYDKLSKLLLDNGAILRTVRNGDIARALEKQEENILAMLTSFNFLLKSRGQRLEDIQAEARGGYDDFVVNKIIAPFVKAYRQMEEERGEIDFTDSIIKATELCNNGHRPDYDYILVDEFQDISIDRYQFLQALRRGQPLTKLFCVGDDWQSIYRFAGSDMALFKHFEEYFGYTKKCRMETTYRFGEPAIGVSSKFILANPEQEAKKVRAFSDESKTVIDFVSTNGRPGVAQAVMRIADSLPMNKELILIGRYSFDVNVLKNQDGLNVYDQYVMYGKRRIDFLTIHKSKGLESDYVILLNCNGGTIGFPSQISDSPALKYVLSEPDVYAFSEERRIFYVGITRAKKHTWVLYDSKNPSPFISEFVKLPKPKEDIIPEENRCPKCNCGVVVEKYRGKAINGNPFTVYGCSNEKYGCDYRETFFVNLYGHRRRY